MTLTSEIHLANKIRSSNMEKEDIQPAPFLLPFPEAVVLYNYVQNIWLTRGSTFQHNF